MHHCYLQIWQVLFPLLFLIYISCLYHLSSVTFLSSRPLCSLVHFKNGNGYLTRGTALVFISLARFLLHFLVSSSFLVRLRYYHYYSYSWWVFHVSVSWWFFTGVWVTASLFKFPGLFSVFWPISYYSCYYYSTPFRDFHTSVSWWFSLEFEWQQVSSSLRDSSSYTCRF